MAASKWKPYPLYDTRKIGWKNKIPSKWIVKKLGRCFSSIGSGTTPNSSNENNFINGTIPWVNTGELRESWIFETHKKITEEAFNENSALKIHPAGSLLVAMYGATIGRLGWLGIPSTVNQAVCCFSEPIEVDPEFVYYWLLANKKDYIAYYSSGGGQPNVNQEKLCNLRIPMPDKSTQEKIVKLCKKIDNHLSASINKLEIQELLIEEKRSAIITEVVTKGLNPDVLMRDSGSKFVGLIPIHWVFTEIKRYCTRISDGSHYSPETEDLGMPYISVKDIDSEGNIDTIGCKKISAIDFSKLVKGGNQPPPNSVLITKDGTIGRAAVVSDSNEFVVLSSLGIIEPDTRFLDPHFLRFLLISNPIVSSIFSMIEGSALTRITIEKMNRISAPIPPVAEQRDIASHLNRECTKLSAMIDSLRKQIKALKEYRTALISAAVTGQIDVRDYPLPEGTA